MKKFDFIGDKKEYKAMLKKIEFHGFEIKDIEYFNDSDFLVICRFLLAGDKFPGILTIDFDETEILPGKQYSWEDVSPFEIEEIYFDQNGNKYFSSMELIEENGKYIKKKREFTTVNIVDEKKYMKDYYGGLMNDLD